MYWKLCNIGLTPHCLYRYSLTLSCEMKNAFNNNRSLLKSGYGAFCLIANIVNVRAKDKVWIKPDTKSFFARTAEYFLVFSNYVYLVICAAYGVTFIWISFHLIIYSYCSSYFKAYPLHIGRKLNVRKMFRELIITSFLFVQYSPVLFVISFFSLFQVSPLAETIVSHSSFCSLLQLYSLSSSVYLANIYTFIINNRSTRKKYEICFKVNNKGTRTISLKLF